MKIRGVILLSLLMQNAIAGTLIINMQTTENETPIGTIKFEDTPYGLLVTPELNALGPGLHGMHVHQTPNCSNAGKAAGGHLDLQKHNEHLGPYNSGHLGDLPVLYVDSSGSAQQSSLAPRLKLHDLKGRSIIIHQGGDNYSDKPLPLGGGNERIACGVIK